MDRGLVMRSSRLQAGLSSQAGQINVVIHALGYSCAFLIFSDDFYIHYTSPV